MITSNTQTLWITVDNPVDNPPKTELGSPPHAPPLQKELCFISDLISANGSAVAHLHARVEQLEFQVAQLISLTDEPLTPDQLLTRLKELKQNRFGEQLPLFDPHHEQ